MQIEQWQSSAGGEQRNTGIGHGCRVNKRSTQPRDAQCTNSSGEAPALDGLGNEPALRGEGEGREGEQRSGGQYRQLRAMGTRPPIPSMNGLFTPGLAVFAFASCKQHLAYLAVVAGVGEGGVGKHDGRLGVGVLELLVQQQRHSRPVSNPDLRLRRGRDTERRGGKEEKREFDAKGREPHTASTMWRHRCTLATARMPRTGVKIMSGRTNPRDSGVAAAAPAAAPVPASRLPAPVDGVAVVAEAAARMSCSCRSMKLKRSALRESAARSTVLPAKGSAAAAADSGTTAEEEVEEEADGGAAKRGRRQRAGAGTPMAEARDARS